MYEILTPQRIQRQERRIEWGCSLRVRMRFRDLLFQLVDLESEPQSPERDQQMLTLQEDIRALPGFPQRYDPERDTIVPITTSAMR